MNLETWCHLLLPSEVGEVRQRQVLVASEAESKIQEAASRRLEST